MADNVSEVLSLDDFKIPGMDRSSAAPAPPQALEDGQASNAGEGKKDDDGDGEGTRKDKTDNNEKKDKDRTSTTHGSRLGQSLGEKGHQRRRRSEEAVLADRRLATQLWAH